MGNALCLGRRPGDEDPELTLSGKTFRAHQGSTAAKADVQNMLAQSPSDGVLSKLANAARPIQEPQPLPDSSPTKVAQTQPLPLPDKVAQPMPDSIRSDTLPPPNTADLASCMCMGGESSSGTEVAGLGEEAQPGQQQVTGKPWDCKALGAPYAPNNQGGADTALALGLSPAPECTELDLIMRTLCRVFEAPYAIMALYYNRRAWVTNSSEWPLGVMPWKLGACPWNCLTTQPQVIACGELQEDARFHHQPWVDSGLRCYVSAPLLASNGHRMGAVCFLDTVPRRVDAGMCRVLSNFGELAIRVLERHIGLAQRLTAAHQAVPHQLHTLMEAAYTGRDVRSSRSPGSSELRGLDEGHWDQQGVADDAAMMTMMGRTVAVRESAGLRASMSGGGVEGTLSGQEAVERRIKEKRRDGGNRGGTTTVRDATSACPVPQPSPSRPGGGAAAEPLPADVLLSSVFARQLRSSEVLKDACTLVVDTGVAGWTVMYADETWKLWAGFSRNELLGRPLQALLSPATPGVAPLNWAALQREVEGGERFVVPGVVAVAPQVTSSAQPQSQQQQQQQQCQIGQGAQQLHVSNPSLSAETNAFSFKSSKPRLHVRRSADMASSRWDMVYDQDMLPLGKAHAVSTALETAIEPDSVTDFSHLSDAQGIDSPPAQSIEDLLSAVVQHEWAHGTEGQPSPASGPLGGSQPSGSGVEMWHEAAGAQPYTRSSTPCSTPAVSTSNITNITTNTNTTATNTTARSTLASSSPHALPGGRVFDLSFRPLALDVLDEDALPLGIPSWVPLEACAPMLRLYAVRLHATMAAAQPPQPLTPSVKLTSVRSSTLQQLAGHLFPGLGMGHVLGRGGYGTAYTGTWHDVAVVVKVQDHQLDGMESLRTAQVEVALGQMLRHPHLVRTLGHGAAEVAPCTTPVTATTFLDASGQAQLGTWTGMAGGNMASPCPSPSQMTAPRPQKPVHASFSLLSKWILEAENDWDGYGANSWFRAGKHDCGVIRLQQVLFITSSAQPQSQQQQQQQQCQIGQGAQQLHVSNPSLSAETNAFSFKSSKPRLHVRRSADMASSRWDMVYDQDMLPLGKAHAVSTALETAIEPDSVTDFSHLSDAQGIDSPPAQSIEDLLSAVVQHEWAHGTEGQPSPASGPLGGSQPSGSGVEMWHEAAGAQPYTRSSTPCSTPAVSTSNITNITTNTNTTATNTTARSTLASSSPHALPGGRVFDLSFRPLALDVLDEDALPLGIPSWVPLEACAPMLRLYAVRLHATMAAAQPPQPLTPSVKLTSVRSSTLQQLAGHLFPGLGMGHVLGRGGYGTAYTGTWHDVAVVVKVQDHQLDGMESLRTAQVEVALGQMLRHPHLVRTLGHGAAEVAPCTTPVTATTFLDASGQAQLGTWTGMAGGNMASPCPSPSQMTAPRPQKPVHASFSLLSKWILEAENDWDGYGANSWFSHCSEEDLVRRTLLTSTRATGTSSCATHVTMLRADQLPPPINFINAVSVAPDILPPSVVTRTATPKPTHTLVRTHMPALVSSAAKTIEVACAVEPSGSFFTAGSGGTITLAVGTGYQDSEVVKGYDAVHKRTGASDEDSRAGPIHSVPTWALDTSNISYLPVTGAPAPPYPATNEVSACTSSGVTCPGQYVLERPTPATGHAKAAPAVSTGQARPSVPAAAAVTAAATGKQPVVAAQPQEALLQVDRHSFGGRGGGNGDDHIGGGDEGVQELLPPTLVLPADGSGLSAPSLPSSFLMSDGCQGRGDRPGPDSSTMGAAGTSGGASNSSLSNFNAPQRVSTEMASMIDSAQRHATHVGAKPMQFPMHLRTFAILEYCDGGTLQDAVDRGWLRKGSIHIDSPIDLSKVVTLASHVACAAAYLHERGVVHADLSAGNVLLCSKRPMVSAGQDAFLTAADPTTTTTDAPTTHNNNNNNQTATTALYQATPLSGSNSSWYTENPSAKHDDSTTAPGTTAVGSTAVGSTAVGSTAVGSTAADSTAVGSTAVGSTAVGSTAVDSTTVGSSAVGSSCSTSTNTNTIRSGGEELLYTLPTKRYSLAPSKARSADEFEFVAKVSDFGKSCLLGPEGVIKAGGYATVTHMAPEVLREHLLSPAADVYALGVLIWQMCTCSRPWAGMTHRQVYSTVISGRLELEWPDKITKTLPLEHRPVAARLVALGRTCLAHKAAARPTMAAVQRELAALAEQLSQHSSDKVPAK